MNPSYDPTLKTLVEASPVSEVPQARVPEVIGRMKERLSQERPRRAHDLWAVTYVLLGLRYSKAFARLLFREVMGMEESVTYQEIVQKGRLSTLRRVILRQGQKLFGPIDEATEKAINAIDSERKLDKLSERILDVGSWQELLTPTRRPRRNGRQQGNT